MTPEDAQIINQVIMIIIVLVLGYAFHTNDGELIIETFGFFIIFCFLGPLLYKATGGFFK